MLNLTGLAFLIAAQGASMPKPPELTVAQLASRIRELDGKVVRVRGWVDPACYAFGCFLRAERSTHGPSATIMIGYDAAVEPEVQRAKGRQVVVEGRVTAACQRPAICTDRGPDIMPIRVIDVAGMADAAHKDH